LKIKEGFDINASGQVKNIMEESMSGPKIKRRKVIKLYVAKSILPFMVKIIKSNESLLLKNTPGIRFFIDDVDKYVREMARKVAGRDEKIKELEKQLIYLQGRVDQLESKDTRFDLSDIQSSVERDLIRDQLFKELESLSWWNFYKKYLIKEQLLELL